MKKSVTPGQPMECLLYDRNVKPKFGYYSGYRQPNQISEQVSRIGELLPGIGQADENIAERPLPPFADGWYACPHWEAVAPTYSGAVEKVFELLKQSRHGKFQNFCYGRLGPKYLRQHKRTTEMFKQLGARQSGNNILVFAAQFGLYHQGHSIQQVVDSYIENEFGLGAFAVGIMLLTHPVRLAHYHDLWCDCPGDEYRHEISHSFESAPYYSHGENNIRFSSGLLKHQYDGCGSVTGFI